ncbi:hypothetical protein HYG86_09695 [Alkalicella caledoniensis]|uniref:Uncharacterized protein n=1 Tax=Alkalicella caledoniensis TaxID=2731377 RepID=A0A7G9W8K9_ALKCA|nr:hypothetical protein [Alkalicella caledoniensis]QNO15021.1 hypothetical protein HYG86_09695 [Alkalicella caledoniensis]
MELFLHLLDPNQEINPIIIAPVAFLLAKLCYDLILLIKYREKLFLYVEDYIKEIILVFSLSILAGGIVFLSELLIRGNVRMSILAVITSLYLKK